jgi:hypothetical protein
MPTQTRPAPDRSRFQVQTITKQALLAAGQLLVAGVVTIVWQTIANALGWTESRQFPLAPAGPQILNACIIAALGFCSALLVARLLPTSAGAGLWVWLPPTALLVLLIGWDFFGRHLDWRWISAWYFWNYPYQKVGPIGRDLFTYPTLSAIAYSLGVLARVLQSRKVSDS